MKNSEYWQKRNIQLEKAAHSYGIDTYRKIEPAFTKAQRDIQKELEAWYGRFAVNNNVSIQEAKRLLNSSELKELKWDVQEYIEHCKENKINQMWVKQLENASAKYHISRLEALKIRTQQAAELAFGNEVDCIDNMAAKVFTNSYYHQMYEVQKGFNVGWDIGTIDNKKLNKIITKPWTADGKNFSDRIWQSKQQLITELHNELTRNCILGEAPDRLINSIAKKFDVAKSQASRLVMTEQAYFHSAAQKEAYNDLDVEEYQIVATLDNRTSAICQSLDLKHFPMSEYKEGSTAPPFHPHCRSVTVPYFDDEFTKDEMRAARDEKGKTYYVPADMSYDEWKKKCVRLHSNEKNTANVKIELPLHRNDTYDYLGKIDKNIFSCVTNDIITDDVIITKERLNHIKERHPNDFKNCVQYITEMIKSPDYIVEANKPNTAVILKSFENGKYKAILKIITSKDAVSYKNSIITFQKVHKKEWKRLLKNKKILYKDE